MHNPTWSRRVAGLLAAVIVGSSLALAGPVGPAGAAAPTEAPEIISPNGGETVTANPVLLWSPLPGITRYRVQVSTSATFSSTLWSADAYNTSATPPVDLPLGTLYWRVAGMDGSSVGPYEATQFVRDQAAAPTPLAPANGEVLPFPGEPVVLRWTPVPGAKNYRVEVDDALDFIGAQHAVTDVPNWALPTTLPMGQTYYWRVQAQGAANGVNTPFSDPQAYSLEWASSPGTPLVPVLEEPAPGQVVTDVVLRWSAVAGAARYQVQVSPNGDWTNNITFDQTVKGTSYSPAVTLNNASYFWRVRALSVRNPSDAGPWSPDGRQFTRQWADEPRLVSPADGDLAADEFLLRWDPVPFASAYEVQVGTDPNFSSPSTYATCTTTHTDLTPTWYEPRPPSPIAPPSSSVLPGTCDLGRSQSQRLTYGRQGVLYHWRVRGLDQSGPKTDPTVLGRFSEVRSFEHLPAGGSYPHPISPAPGSTVEVPVLRWAAVVGAEIYEVRVFRNGNQVQVAKVSGTSYVPSLSLSTNEASSTITWTVRALQHDASGGASNGGSGPVVDGGAFTLLHAETAEAGEPVPVAPLADASLVHPEFDWTPVEAAHHYEVRLATRGSSNYQVLTDHNEGSGSLRNPWRSAFTPTRPIPPGSYDWYVVALDKDDAVLSQSAIVPLTVEDLALAVPTAPANCTEGGGCAPEASTPLLRWNPVPHAGYYRVYVALDDAFTNIVRVYGTTHTSLRPMEALPDNQAGQSYHWFVRPCRNEDACGRFDSGVFPTAWAFRKRSVPTVLDAPADGSSVANQPTFSWGAPSRGWVGTDANDDVEARSYLIQVSTTPDFASILDSAEVDQTTFTPHAKTYPEGPLYWRVQARDASGNHLTMSEERRVDKVSPPPIVTTPAAGADVNGAPVVEWEAQAFAAKYEVEYYRNGDLAWTPSNRVQTTSTQLNADTMVKALPLGTYAFRVRRLDVDNRPGPWSAGRTFDVVGGTPSPTAPANGQVFSQPRVRLAWDPVPGAVQYRVETSATAGFASLIENQVTVMTAWAPVKSYPNGTIHWRVRALDAQSNVLGTSSARSYVHDLTRPSAAVTRVQAGPASVRLEWSANAASAVGPITSFVVRAYVGSNVALTETVGGGARSMVFAGLTNDTRYQFTVTPQDDNGAGTESSKSAQAIPRKVAPFTSIDRFVTRQFQDFYGRKPTSAELSTWRTRLQGSTTPEAMVVSLWDATPHANVVPPIARLYKAFFLRVPDREGVTYWTGRMRTGSTNVYSAASFFAVSAEFVRLYGNLSNRKYVEQVYRNVLGRPGEAVGVQFWTAELDKRRRTRGQVMVGFSESAEYKRDNRHSINASILLITMLGRTPTTAEHRAVMDRLRGGATVAQLVRDTMALPEYAARAT